MKPRVRTRAVPPTQARPTSSVIVTSPPRWHPAPRSIPPTARDTAAPSSPPTDATGSPSASGVPALAGTPVVGMLPRRGDRVIVPVASAGLWQLTTSAPVVSTLQCPSSFTVVATDFYVPTATCDLTVEATSDATSWRVAPRP